MVKTLRFSLLSLLVMVCAMASADTYTYTFTAKTFSSAGTQTLGDIDWTLTTDAGYFGYDTQSTDKGQQIGSKAKPATSVVLSTSDISGTITSIKVNTSGASNINATLDVTVGKTAFGSQYTLTKTATDVTFEGSAKGEIALTYTNNSSIAIYIKSIEVVYTPEGGVAKKSAGLSFSATTATATLGTEFTAPTLTKETTANVSYSSSDESVATVDASTGAVTLVAAGTTTITAKAEANDVYEEGSATYTLTVLEPAKETVSVPYTESFATDKGSFTIDDVNLPDALTYVWAWNSYKYMRASAYKSGNHASESWLVSPWIELDTDVVDELSFDQCISKFFGTVSEEATLWIKVKDGDWKQVAITYPEITSGNWSSFETQTINLEEYAGKSIKVGFKYTSTSDAAGTWEVKNFSVTGTSTPTAINTVKAGAEANAPIYNLAGQRLVKLQKGLNIVGGKKVLKK